MKLNKNFMKNISELDLYFQRRFFYKIRSKIIFLAPQINLFSFQVVEGSVTDTTASCITGDVVADQLDVYKTDPPQIPRSGNGWFAYLFQTPAKEDGSRHRTVASIVEDKKNRPQAFPVFNARVEASLDFSDEDDFRNHLNSRNHYHMTFEGTVKIPTTGVWVEDKFGEQNFRVFSEMRGKNLYIDPKK